MPEKQSIPPRVFISYSHDSHEHLDRVLALADRLRAEGIDCNLDQYEPSPHEGWPRWMESQFKQADFILVICTETYCRRFEGREAQGKGLGVKWEGAIITGELYRDEAVNKRFIPVVFTEADTAHVPERLQHYMRYLVAEETQYELLYRHLTKQPRVIRPELGKIRTLEPVNKLNALPIEDRQQEFVPIPEASPKTKNISKAQPVIVQPAQPAQTPSEKLNGVKLEMVYIPGGEFLMGSNESRDEGPIHRVKLSPYFIGKYPVTQAQWKAVMGNNPSRFQGDDLPVETVSWQDANKFCETISAKTGKTYRLPTEAEWEMACRAGSNTRYYFGDDKKLLGEYAWFSENAGGKTHPVGQKKPNDWGLFDMHGNVWELCADWYDGSYYGECDKLRIVTDPLGPAAGSLRVIRGGSWAAYAVYCRSAIRADDVPGARVGGLGFRLVRIDP